MIRTAFAAFQARFHVITRRARERFATRDWHGMRADATERLLLYREVIDRIEQRIRQRIGDRLHDKALWGHIRTAYSHRVADRPDAELAETFFNSVTRRIFNTVGVDPNVEFVTTDLGDRDAEADPPVTHVIDAPAHTEALADALLRTCALSAPFRDRAGDTRRMARFLSRELDARARPPTIRRAEILRPVFYRGVGAYVVGCLHVGDTMVPLAVAFHNHDDGIAVDAVLLDEDAISILFSFARSYFHVDTRHPSALVRFLKRILPRKRIAELYIAIGYNKHGKTELYRDLLHPFATTDDAFVKTVITMPR
jgi:isocitrate dehydrogenase kinase/phosphatase